MAKFDKSLGVINTRDLFLTCMGFMYLFAFTSLYHQMPGLYGDTGILPVRSFAQLDKRGLAVLDEVIFSKPSLVWFAPQFGLNFDLMLDLIAILGIIFSSMVIVSRSARIFPFFITLYILYFSLYQVGQEFLWFQWDILLLEAGFLCLLIAPLANSLSHSPSRDPIVLWLVKWLLFRLMFTSGIVKLTSKCPTWWTLTALNYHFESQCLPTPLAWYAHQLPKWFLRLGVVGTYVIEIGIPFLFFGPAPLRRLSFWSQIFFQFCIILTGNYNFFNLLTIVLCIPLLQDSDFPAFIRRAWRIPPSKASSRDTIFTASTILFLAHATIRLFNLKIESGGVISSKVAFTEDDLTYFLKNAVPLSITIGLASLCYTILRSFYRSITNGSLLACISRTMQLVFYSALALWIFSISLVPYTGQMEKTTYKSIWPVIHRWHHSTQPLVIVNSYGLFRQMTGIGGRPELILEASDSLESGWKEYHFLYKPGDVKEAPKFLIPHQPRLDWQMWFAALGEYQNNPWLLSFIYRLLTKEKAVIDLIDNKKLPFDHAPNHIRVKQYLYHYTTLNERSKTGHWWKRDFKKIYLPPVTKESATTYLKSLGIQLDPKVKLKVVDSWISRLLSMIRSFVNQVSPNVFIYTFAACLLSIKLL